MALSFVAARGTAQTKTAGTTIAVSPTANLAAGAIVVVKCISDNPTHPDGETTDHAVDDDVGGNTWEKCREQTESGGAASAGVCISTHICHLTNGITTADSVILTIAASVAAKAIMVEEWSVGAGQTYNVAGANGASLGTSGTPAITLSGLAASTEYGFLAHGGREGGGGGAGGFGTDADYTTVGNIGTSGGSGASNVDQKSEYRIATLTSDTYDQTSPGGEVALILVAIEEVSAGGGGVTLQPGVGQITFTGFSPSLRLALLPGASEVTLAGFAPSLPQNLSLLPGTSAITFAGFGPSLQLALLPGTSAVVFTGFEPIINTGAGLVLAPGVGQISLAGFAPALRETTPVGVGQLVFAGFAPSLDTSVRPGVGEIVLTGFAASLQQNLVLFPGTSALVFAGLAPGLRESVPMGVGQIVLTGFAPTVVAGVIAGLGRPPLGASVTGAHGVTSSGSLGASVSGSHGADLV